MNIDYLKEFLMLAESLNFTKTAKELYTSQPVLSKHMSTLEQQLDAKLFVRGRHRIYLTSIGEVFAQEAKNIIDTYDHAIGVVEAAKHGYEGSLTVGFLAGAVHGSLDKAMIDFYNDHPELGINYVACEAKEMIPRLSSGMCDVVIGTNAFFDVTNMPEYDWKPLYKDYQCVIVPQDHRLASLTSVSVEDLAGETIMTTKGSGNHGAAALFNSADLEKLEITLRENEFGIDGYKLLLNSVDCIAIALSHMNNILGDEFSFIPLREAEGSEFYVGALWRKGTQNTILDALLTYMEDAAQKMSSNI